MDARSTVSALTHLFRLYLAMTIVGALVVFAAVTFFPEATSYDGSTCFVCTDTHALRDAIEPVVERVEPRPGQTP